MAFKKWNCKRAPEDQAQLLSQECGISPFLAEILVSRGMDTPAKAAEFLGEDEPLSDPFLLADMDKAVERLHRAIEEGEKIVVYGDYDCDGVTATAIMMLYLSSVGADASYYIPERDGEGYGLNADAVRALAEQGTDLIVTVDNGISALSESVLIKELGMDLVITDHHQAGELLPDAYAVVDPHRRDCPSPFKALCGAGVALKLITAMEGGDYDATLDYFADIAAIGTIGDVVSLTGENRTLVKKGLSMLSVTENPGLRALMEAAGINPAAVTSQQVAFGLAPRINAAGRLGSASLAAELLLCEDEEQAAAIAAQMNELNQTRQQLEKDILAQIDEQLAQHPEKLYSRVLVLAGENWHHGVIGIVSAKLLERYGKPNILLSVQGGEARGSARSTGDFNLYDALCSCSELFTRFGGHRLAAGMSLLPENIPLLEEKINAYAAEHFDEMPQVTYSVDKILKPREITLENIRSLEALEPCGEQNPSPLFCLGNARIHQIIPLSEGKHLRLRLVAGRMVFSAVYFGVGPDSFPYKLGDTVDMLVTLEINTFKGKESVSMKIKDIRPNGFEQKKFFSAKNTYERLRRGEPVDPRLKERIVPGREDTAIVYKYLTANHGFKGDIDGTYIQLYKHSLNYCQIRASLDILQDVKLISVSPLLNSISVAEHPGKKNLNDSPTLQRLQNL